MSYKISILRNAQKELSLLPLKDYERIKKAIFSLAKNPRPHNCLKLTGRDGWRIRIGNYRVIYEINDKLNEITVFHAGHRKYIYKK
jgi:mRNA interferase RelE/StbE